MTCMDCHSLEDVHGDGNSYDSMLEEGAIDASCDDCHTSVASNAYHDGHAELLDCSTCHTQGIVSCYNCHFEGQLDSPPIKKARAQFTSWMFLVNDESGKVHPANVQTLEYQGQTFVAMAPFFGHTIDRNAVTSCGDCHGNAAIDAFNADSTLAVWQLLYGTPLTDAQLSDLN